MSSYRIARFSNSFSVQSITALAIIFVLGFTASIAKAEDRSNWPKSFSVGTASQGGTYFVYGSGWTNMVSEALGIPGGLLTIAGITILIVWYVKSRAIAPV